MTKHLISCLMFLAVLTLSMPAMALLSPTIRVTPASKEISINATASFVITWKPRSVGPGVNLTVEADNGVLRIGTGGAILKNTGTLSRTYTLPPALNSFESTLTETLTVPRDYVRRALKAGEALTYTREFSDDGFGTSVFATVTIVPGSASAADFDVSRIALTFGDDSSSRTTTPGEKLIALARLKTSGAGLVRGAWEIRDGGVTGNFRTLRNVQQSVAGGQDAVLTSPALPTGEPGRYDVRLRLDAPDVTFDMPYISYYIGGMPGGDRVVVTAPEPGAPLTGDTLIRWKPVTGAKAYRIEARKLGRGEDGPPDSAMMASPGKFSARPSPLFLEGLDPDGKYRISIIAIQ